MSKSNKPTVQSIFVEAASTFAEALQVSGSGSLHNVFGRPVSLDANAGLGKLLGLSSNGIRTAAFVDAKELRANLNHLACFKRMHIPLTMVVGGPSMIHLAQIAQTGAIIFQVKQSQELQDFVLMAQVISEKALVPVVILTNDQLDDTQPILPNKKELQEWFGDPDLRVPDPTPAQTMVMGKMRRRMPAWIHVDHPAFIGAQKNENDLLFERAAQSEFEQVHLQQIIDDTFLQFAQLSNRKYGSYTFVGNEKARYAAICSGSDLKDAQDIITLKPYAKKRVAIITLNQLNPIPSLDRLKGAKLEKLLVLEKAQDAPSQGWLFKEISSLNVSAKAFQNGWFVEEPNVDNWQRALDNLISDNGAKDHYWLDIAFSKSKSTYPKHEVLLEQVQRDYPNANKASLATKGNLPGSPSPIMVPAMAKEFAGKGAPYGRLNRFFDDVACLYDMPDERVAEPFQAYPIMPAASALFNKPPTRTQIPRFSPEKAHDVETYAKVCPHGALPTSLFTIADLIKSGIAAARSRGETISLLVPLSKVWAKNAAEFAMDKKAKIKFAKDFLVPGFEKSLPMAKKDPEATKLEYELVMAAIGEVPVSITDAHFVELEKAKPGSGELFSLAVDPTACSGCGLCAESCSDGAIKMVDYAADLEAEQQAVYNRFNTIPETAPATISRLLALEEFDPYAALQLNKGLYYAFAGNGVNWQYAAESIVLRMILAQAQSSLAARYAEVTKQISVKTAALNNAIKKVLSDAMPVTSLDALMDVVTSHSEEKLSMDRIFGEWGEQQAFKAIAKEELERKLEALEGLKQLKWALKEGLNGRGRNAFSLVIDESLAYAANYPWNGFQVSALFAESGATNTVALGVFEGQIRNALDNIRLLRRAELEGTGKYKADVHNAEIANITYQQLTDEERLLVPPLFVLASEHVLANANSSQLHQLISSGYPIKIIILESGSLSSIGAAAIYSSRSNALWPVVANQLAFAGRASLANPKHMYRLLEDALHPHQPALVSVFTPNAFSYNIHPARWAAMSKLAESTRFFIPLRFTPGEGATAAEKIELDIENINSDWNKTELQYKEGEVDKKVDYQLTPADYLYLLTDWKRHFTLQKKASNMVQVADYLELDEAARQSKVPAITRVSEVGDLIHFVVSDEVVHVCSATKNYFHLVREWAGLFTPFPEKLREEVRQEMQAEFDAEKKKLQAEIAAEKKTWEAEHLNQLKAQVKERLMKMAGHL